jgi:tRNA(Ile2)-agmatinylcytidine synthase
MISSLGDTHFAKVTEDSTVVHDRETLHIGFDDTDSRLGRCTTHMAFKITEYILKTTNADFIDNPLLIRLNPNIPWKTRGNGAVCLRIRMDRQDQQRIVDFVKHHIETHSATGKGANPGVVFFRGRQIPEALMKFSTYGMFDILHKQIAIKLANKYNIEYFILGNGRGLVGAIAAIGCVLDGDHTFEAIAFRRAENCGTLRNIDINKVIEFSRSTFPYTFNNIDYANRRLLISPHGPDPVFCGIRGESAEIVLSSLISLKIQEKLEGCMVFRTNQGTNMHLQHEIKLPDARSFTSGHIRCKVSVKPQTIQGGHTLFVVESDDGFSFPAAVYEPTGLATVASLLAVGDVIEIGCGVRKASSKHPRTLNVEYLMVLELADVFEIRNPVCSHCSKSMKSEGRDKGFQCKRCKQREPPTMQKVKIKLPRKIKPELYVPLPKAHRHLTKPLQRYGLEKKSIDYDKSMSDWFFSNFDLSNKSMIRNNNAVFNAR